MSSGSTVWRSASPTGGPETIAAYSTMPIIRTPSTTTMRSMATPARLLRKMPMAIAAEIAPPTLTSSPSIALAPSAVPPMLPMLKTSPPSTTSAART